MATIPFVAYEISGIRNADGLYPSAAANKKYVDDKVVAAGGVTNSAFKVMSPGFGIAPFPTTIRVSGSQNFAISAATWLTSTVSSNARIGSRFVSESSNKLHGAYLSASTGVFALDTISITAGNGLTGGGTLEATRTIDVGAGTGIGVAADSVSVLGYSVISSNAKSGQIAQKHLIDSGAKYHGAVLSGQKVGAWWAASSQKLTFKSGWDTTSNGSKVVTHNLGAIPNAISITPSGSVSWGYVVNTITTSQFTLSITAAGSRVFSWRVQV